MKDLVLPSPMSTFLATTVGAQAQLTMTTNWLAAHHQTLGANAPAGWLMDLDADEMEIYVTAEKALVLLDRRPIFTADGTACLRKGLQGLGGIQLRLLGEIRSVNDSVLHGSYAGTLAGTPVLMEQYVRIGSGVPSVIVRIISRVGASVPDTRIDADAIAVELLGRSTVIDRPALTRN